MEACAYAFALARYLKRQTGCAVYVLNPGKRAMIGKPAWKTDNEDARKTARFIRRYPEEELLLAEVPSVEEEEFGSLVSLKGFLTRERTRAVNRPRALYAQAGITDLKKSSLAKAGGRPLRAVILQALRALLRSKEGALLRRKFLLLNERTGKTKSAIAAARRLVCLLVTRREFCADMSRKGFLKRFRRYRIAYEGWGKADNRPVS
jgi:hypothetical protein